MEPDIHEAFLLGQVYVRWHEDLKMKKIKV